MLNDLTFETDRLTVSHWAADLAFPSRRKAIETRLELILTKPVLAPLPPALHLGGKGSGISNWIEARAEESDVFLIETRDRGTIVGLLILAVFEIEHLKTVHLGYLFAEESWGKGLATELLIGLVAALTEIGPVELIGGVDTHNVASSRVLTKAGFSLDKGQSSDETQIFTRVVG